jgi:hypothetical protein
MRKFVLAIMLPAAACAAGWTSLIQGTSLSNWQAEGKADWKVEGGAIVGRQGAGGAPGDLFTRERWKDFELESEWKMHWPGNSGIWFRWAGPKTGYQADFLDEPKSYPGVLSGSLYCMGKAFIARNGDAGSLKRDGWNKMRITARGDHLVIQLNGKTVVDVHDATFAGPGSVGIQVHQGKAFDGMEVRVRKFRIRPLN